jgi:hypothetical protein
MCIVVLVCTNVSDFIRLSLDLFFFIIAMFNVSLKATVGLLCSWGRICRFLFKISVTVGFQYILISNKSVNL